MKRSLISFLNWKVLSKCAPSPYSAKMDDIAILRHGLFKPMSVLVFRKFIVGIKCHYKSFRRQLWWVKYVLKWPKDFSKKQSLKAGSSSV